MPDPNRIVAEGNDRIVQRCAKWSDGSRDDPGDRFLPLLKEQLSIGAAVRELDCGTDALSTRRRAARCATGVDLAGRGIDLARQNAPTATFGQANVTAIRLPPASFDAVAAFYAVAHVPRAEHAALRWSITGWLRPGNLPVASTGAASSPGDIGDDWLGAPMHVGHHDAETSRRLVQEAGLRLLSDREETTGEDSTPVVFLWVVAQRPETARPSRPKAVSADRTRRRRA